jgi:hypothetical protein
MNDLKERLSSVVGMIAVRPTDQMVRQKAGDQTLLACCGEGDRLVTNTDANGRK